LFVGVGEDGGEENAHEAHDGAGDQILGHCPNLPAGPYRAMALGDMPRPTTAVPWKTHTISPKNEVRELFLVLSTAFLWQDQGHSPKSVWPPTCC
jgi:hypothetical protein